MLYANAKECERKTTLSETTGSWTHFIDFRVESISLKQHWSDWYFGRDIGIYYNHGREFDSSIKARGRSKSSNEDTIILDKDGPKIFRTSRRLGYPYI